MRSSSHDPSSMTMITDHSLDQDVFVQVLDVSSCSSLSDNSLRALAHGCPQVQWWSWLGVDYYEGNNLDLLVIITMRMVIMVIIKVVKCLPMGVPRFQEDNERCFNIISRDNIFMLQLISLNISWCELLTAQGVGALAEGCNKLRTFISKVILPLSLTRQHHHHHNCHCCCCHLGLSFLR